MSFATHGASVTLVSGAGAPATLIGGTSASAATFKAPTTSSYVFQFAATGGADAHVSVSCTSTYTEAANAAFLDRRKALLNAREPDRLRIDRAATPIANPDKPLSSTVAVDEEGRPKDVEFSVSVSELAAATQGGKPVDPGIVDFWVEGRMQSYASTSLASGTSDGNLGSIYLGTRSMVGPDIMLGALAQFDRAVESSSLTTPEMAAEGWMAGPYVSMKLGSGVVFDGRAAWGETANAVASPDIDDSLTARRLVRGKFTGTREVQGWNVAPSVGLVYIEDAVRELGYGRNARCRHRQGRSAAGGVEALCPRRRDLHRAARRRWRVRRLRRFAGAEPEHIGGAADRRAGQGRSRSRLRREGRIELAGDRRRRKRHDVSGDAELDGAAAAQRSARQMTPFRSATNNFVNIRLTSMQWKVISRAAYVTYSDRCR